MDGRTLGIKKRKMAHGEDGVIKFTNLMLKDNLKSVLDIGSGDRRHFDYMDNKIVSVYANDFSSNCDYIGDFNKIVFERTFDGIHCAHVLEHQPNPNLFLKKINSLLTEDGYLCITVPPLKSNIVGGHVSLWNAGLILYHLILAGFDCSNAHIKTYGYNISVIVKKKSIDIDYLESVLVYDSPDMKTIQPYLPPFKFTGATPKTPGAFNGDIPSLNW